MNSIVNITKLSINDKLFPNIELKDHIDLKSSRKRGIWNSFQKIYKKHVNPDSIIEIVKNSELRGRGGAGFPTAKKWGFISKDETKTSYLIVNADESEPGTCKDREIITFEPHRLLEGIAISLYAIQIKHCYIYIRGEFANEFKILNSALEEAYSNKLIPKEMKIYIHRGAGAYICGEETALLNSIEGKRGVPRLKPPFPANFGLYGCPTIINNVETVASLPKIIEKGADWFANIGVQNSKGTKLFCISGNVTKPCVIEEVMGIPLKILIEEYAGGVIGGWDNLLAVIPGGSSVPLIIKGICDTITMDYDALKLVHSSLGTGGIIVINKSHDIIKAIERISHFYMRESCGQCTPCREGTMWMWQLMSKMCNGHYNTKEDIDYLLHITKQIEGHTICAFGDAAAWPIQGLIRHFRKTIEQKDIKKNAK